MAKQSIIAEARFGSALVSDVQSRIVIRVSKRTTALPLGLVENVK